MEEIIDCAQHFAVSDDSANIKTSMMNGNRLLKHLEERKWLDLVKKLVLLFKCYKTFDSSNIIVSSGYILHRIAETFRTFRDDSCSTKLK